MIPDIYSYIDFRLFLKDFFAAKKESGPGFTQREVLARMNISSSGFLANVLSGTNNLTIDQAKTLSRILGLRKNQRDYFKYMVYFSRAKTLGEKNDFYETLQSFRAPTLKKLNKTQLSLFSNWYYVAIRELLHYYKFDGDYDALAAMLRPAITPGKAKKAVEELETAGLIRKNSQGVYEQAQETVSTGDELHSFLVGKFQISMLDLAKQALEEVSTEERDITGVTFSLSREGFREVKAHIQDFRKQLLQIAKHDKNEDMVYRVNFQFFPLTREKGG